VIENIPLHRADYTVLTLHAPTFRRYDAGLGDDRRKIGVAVGQITIRPIAPPSRERPRQQSRSAAFLKALFK
jgi:hypothetical protein